MQKKRPYSSPELRHYGSVRNLTGGSNGMGNDGLGGMTGTNFGMMSDRRLKKNIRKIGDHPAGFALYLFDYKSEFSDICEGRNVFGPMADEVQLVCPEAVSKHASGYSMVDYARLGITRH